MFYVALLYFDWNLCNFVSVPCLISSSNIPFSSLLFIIKSNTSTLIFTVKTRLASYIISDWCCIHLNWDVLYPPNDCISWNFNSNGTTRTMLTTIYILLLCCWNLHLGSYLASTGILLCCSWFYLLFGHP